MTISPFRNEAENFLEQLWTDLDSTLAEPKRALARENLPLGQIFGTFHFGQPTVTIAIRKADNIFSYATTYKWPEGSGRSGGEIAGIGKTLPAELQRFWSQSATD